MTFTKEEKRLFMEELLETPEDELSDNEKSLVEVYWMGYNDSSIKVTNMVFSTMHNLYSNKGKK